MNTSPNVVFFSPVVHVFFGGGGGALGNPDINGYLIKVAQYYSIMQSIIRNTIASSSYSLPDALKPSQARAVIGPIFQGALRGGKTKFYNRFSS